MKKLKKLFSALLLGCLVLFSAACQPAPESRADADGKLSVVCTAFPQYDWLQNLTAGANPGFSITLLNHQGADMHSFQPTAANMVSIAECDLFFYIGGFSETWVDAALESAGNHKAVTVALLDHVDKKEENLSGIVGAEAEHDHDHDHDGEAHDEHAGEIEYDEHIWLSLHTAAQSCEAITSALTALDPQNAALYEKNLQGYLAKLSALDQRYRKMIDGAERKTLLFADRFPFRYLADDYGLTCYAAFPGCSAETEASFETIVELADTAANLKLPAVLILEGSRPAVAETIIETAGVDAQVLTINSMQSVNQRQIDGGLTYLQVMEDNLQVLKRALNEYTQKEN